MKDYNVDFSKYSISEMIELEDEVRCDVDLYKEQIIRLQLDYQAKKISFSKYEEDYSIINEKIINLTDTLGQLGLLINSRIKYPDEFAGDGYSIEDFVEFYLSDEFLEGINHNDNWF